MRTIPEQFYKSRLTSIVISIVAFAVSVLDRKTLDDFKAFDVQVGTLNQPFLIFALLAAAAASLISLWLSFRNEGAPYVKERDDAVDALKGEKMLAEVKQAIGDLRSDRERYRSAVSSPALQGAIEKGIPFPRGSQWLQAASIMCPPAMGPDLFKRLKTECSLQYCEDIEFWEKAESSWIQTRRQHLEQLELMIEQPLFVESETLQQVSEHVYQNDTQALEALEQLSFQLHQHHDAVKLAKRELRAEVYWMGVAFPIAVFAIALMHGLGTLGFRLFRSLPEVTQCLHGQVLAPRLSSGAIEACLRNG